tara:strand:- start:2144 stop:3394 length:1251 start_codon:yes stop_codon:yes gene_type:complete
MFLLTPKFLRLIKNDLENEYFLIYENPALLKNVFESFTNVTIIEPYAGNKWKKFWYYFILQPVELFTLFKQEKIGDHLYLLNQTKYSNPKLIILGYIFDKLSKILYFQRIVRWICFSTSYYQKLEIDKWLITEYHSFKEKTIVYNHQHKPVFFFPCSHDSLTVSGQYSLPLTKILTWHLNAKKLAREIHSIPDNKLVYVGNPSHEEIRSYKDTPRKKLEAKNEILFFASNNFVYNEVEMVQEIKNSSYLNSLGISLRIAPSVGGVGEEWKYRFDSYKKILGEENLYLPTGAWWGENLPEEEINSEYIASLWKHKIFIVPGVSNLAYDILARGGVLILMFYNKAKKKNKFDWWTCEQREVLDHVKGCSGVFVCNSIDEIESSLKNLSSNSDFKSETPYLDQLSSSELILNELQAIID